ncbi:AraC family transcriptional regulator [Cohnella lupini]|uniref:AraC-like protein n=1 Tax=Cohnella lupini TaxID=1294267 RepID=A0A3D9ISV9_9BACL|nr:AraC family transcriptional regulator [Cohnella lupini]RED64871.1 AraC-like protein [Cohnella lupini]
MQQPGYMRNYTNMNKQFPFSIDLSVIDGTLAAHRHDFLEFSYVREGHGTEIINGVRYPLKPGTLTFLLPFQYHEIVSDPGTPLTLYHSGMSPSLLMGTPETGAGLEQLLHEDDSLPPNCSLDETDRSRADRLLDDMFKEHRGESAWKNVVLRSLLLELLVLFDRSRKSAAPTISDRPAQLAGNGSNRHKSFGKVVSYVEARYSETLALAEVARVHHYHETRLSVLFKQHTGQSFGDYLQDVRLRHACALLSTSALKITDIASQTGFGSIGTFNRVFGRKKGLTPSAYRKKFQ